MLHKIFMYGCYLLGIMVLVMISRFANLPFLVGYGLLLVGYGFMARRLSILSHADLAWLIVIALLGRCLLLAKAPLLSDDLYRCLWEGKVIRHGFNPYLLPPASDTLAFLRGTYHPRINHPSLTAIYPPLMLAINAVIGWLYYSPVFYKIVMTGFDLLAAVLMLRLLSREHLPRRRIMLYVMHPLPLMEISWSGHHEAVMVAAMMLTLLLFAGRRWGAAGLALAAAVLTKFVPLIMVGECRRKVSLLGLVTVIFLVYLPFLLAGSSPFSSLSTYARHWNFNASLYTLGSCFVNNHLALRFLLAGAYAVFWVLVNVYESRRYKRLVWLFFGLLLVSPTVHPWYGLWLLPFLVLEPVFELFLFVSFLPFSYVVLERYLQAGIWQEHYLVTGLIYLPAGWYVVKILGRLRLRDAGQ